jgi:DNA helicase-4
MILYRNTATINSFFKSNPEDLFSRFPMLSVSYSTIHSSKGLEADYVIILGLSGGDNGFPSEKDFTSIITKIKKTDESYPYAEERRLFYVALTRAKHNVLILSDYKNPSIFVRELLNGSYEVKSDQAKKTCPKCLSGYLMIKTSKEKRQFLGCTNFNEVENCRYTESI